MVELVSVHGGYSGQFCGHADDALSDVVQAYVDAGFRWVCLTEHMAPNRPDFIPADEAPLDVERVNARFRSYFMEARRLQKAWAGVIDIYVGFETEAFSGYRETVAAAINSFRPDLIVGSVHHVSDVLFDDSRRTTGLPWIEPAASTRSTLHTRTVAGNTRMVHALSNGRRFPSSSWSISSATPSLNR